jgi:hypothetical protein
MHKAVTITNKEFKDYLMVVNFLKHLPLYEFYVLKAEVIKTYKKYPENDPRRYVIEYSLSKNDMDYLMLEKKLIQSGAVRCSKKKLKQYIDSAYELFPLKIAMGVEKHHDANLQETYRRYEQIFFKKKNGEIMG